MTDNAAPFASASTASNPPRARYLDITKGLAIVCIVLLHFSTGLIPGVINVYIGLFMITAFYITAGWVESFKPQAPTFRARVTRLWHQLGVPYIIWTAVILVFDVIFWSIGHYDSFIIARDAYKSICLRGIGTLWFLPALFGGQCLWWWVRKQHRWWIAVLTVAAIYLCFLLLGKFLYPSLPQYGTRLYDIIIAPISAFGAMCNAYVGILCGFAYGKLSSRWRLASRSRWLLIITGCLILALGWYCSFLLPFNAGILYPWLAPHIIPAGFVVLFMALETSPLLRFFDYWGRNSMALMVTHMSILLVISDIVTLKLTGHKTAGAGWLSFATFCVIMAIEYFIAEWLRHRFPRSIGHPAHSKISTISHTENAKHT